MGIKAGKILDWFKKRGISINTLDEYGVTFSNDYINIPVRDTEGKTLFEKHRVDPDNSDNLPKYTYDSGSTVALFNIQTLKDNGTIFITEGELDAILLESKGFHAVSSTGGAGTFKAEWISLFIGRRVFIIYDNDTAGFKGALKVQTIIPWAKIVFLPSSVGFHGDVTDYFKENSIEDFEEMLVHSQSYPVGRTDDSEITTKKARRNLIAAYKLRIDLLMEKKREWQTKRFNPEPIQLMVDINMSYRKEQQYLLNKKPAAPTSYDGNDLERAKSVPIDSFIKFNRDSKAVSIWNPNEKTPSMHYYKKTNRVYCFSEGKGGDVLDVVCAMEGWDPVKDLPKAIDKLLGR